MKKKVAIIGAGLTGLSLAFQLKKAGIPFVIYEKSHRTGGVIQSEKKDGFILEKGPNTGVVANLELANLLDELSDIATPVYADEVAKKRLIWKNGKWEALPSGIKSAVTTPLFTWKDKLKVAGEFLRKKGNTETETLANTVIRRLGNSFLDYAIDPFVSGVYAGDPHYLITKYAFPKLYNLEEKYGSFIKGSLKIAKERSEAYKKKVSKKIFSYANGLQDLTDALTRKIGQEHILLNQPDIEIVYQSPNRFRVNGQDFSHVVTTVNASETFELLPFVPQKLSMPVTNLLYAPVVEISLGFKQWNGIKLDAFGGLIPTKEHKNILGILFMSSQFPNRAPKGGAFFSVFAGGIKKPEILQPDDDVLLNLLAMDFKEVMRLDSFNPDLVKISRHPKAIAQYGADSKTRLESIDKIEAQYPGLWLRGSIKDGIGIADRVAQAYKTAQKLTAQ